MMYAIENSISIFTGLIGFLVVFLIAFSYRSNSLMNIYLIISFIIISIRLFHNGISGFFEVSLFDKAISTLTPIFLIGIPGFYLYFEKLFYHNNRFIKRDLLHFIFPLVLFAFLLLSNNLKMVRSPNLNKTILVLILLYLILYTILANRLVYLNVMGKKYTSTSADLAHQGILKKWSLFLVISLSFVSIRLLLSIIFELPNKGLSMGYTFSTINSLLWLVTFMMILMHPEILYGYAKLQKYLSRSESSTPQENKEVIWKESIDQITNQQDIKLKEAIVEKLPGYILKIDEFIQENRPFHNKKYNLKDLAQDLKIPASHLSFVFKYACKLSFVEFKNYSRVNHALFLLQNDFLDSKTFEALADAVGFATYNTFFISFKQYTGTAPKDFYLEIGT